jgi:hypothetical protein
MKLIQQKMKTLNVSPVESRIITNNDNLINNTMLIEQDNQENIYRLSTNKQNIGTLKHYPPAIKE